MNYKKIKILMIVTIVTIISSGCERSLAVEDNLKNQLEESKTEIEQLKQKITKLELENKNFNRKVGELSSQNPNGLKMEERRKALVEKETNLKIKEDELKKKELLGNEREKSIRQDEKKLLIEHNQFINTKQKELQAIGEAEEMKRNYKQLQKDKKEAENLANNWLIWISILGFIFFISIIALVVLYMRIKDKGRQIVNTFELLNSINLSNEDKKLLTHTLGK